MPITTSITCNRLTGKRCLRFCPFTETLGWKKGLTGCIRNPAIPNIQLMPLNIPTHKTVLFQILKDVYSDTLVAPFLGFKGGTAAVMFYGLERFSVDLYFYLLD